VTIQTELDIEYLLHILRRSNHAGCSIHVEPIGERVYRAEVDGYVARVALGRDYAWKFAWAPWREY
jgi:hypothetical protein